MQQWYLVSILLIGSDIYRCTYICIVDQPVGTGYSLVDTKGYAKSMVEVNHTEKTCWEIRNSISFASIDYGSIRHFHRQAL